MDPTVWLDLAAAALAAEDPAEADEMVASTLTAVTRADLAVHVQLSNTDPKWMTRTAVGDSLPDRPETWPDAPMIRRHPLNAFYAATGETRVTALRDVERLGWRMDDEGRQLVRRLGLPPEQVSMVVGDDPSAFDGWVLLASDPFTEAELDELERVRLLLTGLAKHCRLLRQALAVAQGGPVLTPRERVILCLIAQGRTVEGIAARLAISPRTVHKHQEHLYRKLGAADRLSAVLSAQRFGLLPSL
ncbi:LuxR C-terminal-related transcriptional regulator [Tessaracoccus oleiagri]|uniref:Regulatory protein, luxR family n=1 Tax=Tessaracoccus oleiagri TaxID=686624 RepID=A0A1G9IHY0_9ACTN|nr:LuxR C-terminal-related transcriptional regulator [Tessaracoccus oleiagri]SDL24533.1 regulatory protein, luxR family [Tessaracoccus oleiagri]